MERKTAQDFDPELLILFDAYVHGHVDRRGFLDKATKFTAGGVTARFAAEVSSERSGPVCWRAVRARRPFPRCRVTRPLGRRRTSPIRGDHAGRSLRASS